MVLVGLNVGAWGNADDMLTEEQNELVESAAEMLYGLIHVRYMLTSKGMTAMVRELVGMGLEVVDVWMEWSGWVHVLVEVFWVRGRGFLIMWR